MLGATSANVTAQSDQSFALSTGQAQVGAAAIGASFTRIRAEGRTAAWLDDGAQIGADAVNVVDNLTVAADSQLTVDQATVGMGVGGVVVNANFAFSELVPEVDAAIGKKANVNVTNDVNVTAESTQDATVRVLTATGGVGAVGVSLSDASLAPSVSAIVDGFRVRWRKP